MGSRPTWPNMGSRQPAVVSSKTGSDINKPEVSGNQRQTTWFGKNTLFVQRSGLWRSGWIWWDAGGVGKIFIVKDWRPESRETNVREGDLVGVVGIREGFHSIVSCWLETNSVFDMGETRMHCGGKQFSDQAVDDLSHGLLRIHGCVHIGVNVEGARFLRAGGDKPIHVDPKQIPGHGINGIGETLPRSCPWLMMGVSKATASQIGNIVSGPFDESGSM